MMKRHIITLTFVLLLLLIAGCNKQTTTTDIESLRLGVVIPQSGPIAEVGSFVQDGIELALTEINEQGGVQGAPLKLIYEDDQCNPKNSVTAFTKLTEVDDVKAVLGAFCSGATLAAAPLANEKEVVLLSPGATSQDMTHAGDYVFRVTPSDALESAFLGDFLAENFDNVAVIYLENRAVTDYKIAFEKTFSKTITRIEPFADESKDVRTQLIKIKETNPEALVVLTYPQYYEVITRQAIELGYDIPFFAMKTFETPTSFNLGKDAERYVYATVDYPESNEKTESYKKKFFEVHGEEPSIWSAYGYDATKILAQALEACGEDGPCIKEHLYGIQGYEGVSGIKSFDENGDIKDPYYALKTVRDGKFVKYSS